MKLAGFILFLSYCFYYNPFSRKRAFAHPPQAVWWFLAYVAIYAINGFFISEEFVSQFGTHLLTLVQLVLFLWIASDLLQEEKLANGILFSYSIASSFVAFIIILRLTDSSTASSGTDGRVTAMEQNTNYLAMLMAVAAATLTGLLMSMTVRHRMVKIFFIVLTMLLLSALVDTGSRGGMAAVVIGFLVYLLPYRQSKDSRYAKSRTIGVILAILCVIAVVYMVGNSPTSRLRWQKTYYEGDVSTRDQIAQAGIDMFIEQPLYGWQPFAFHHELGARVRAPSGVRDAHNLFLHLVLQVGMVGTIPFLVGLWLCGWAAWRARIGNFGLLPLALLLTILTVNTTGTYIAQKVMWLILALTLATASTAAKR
jgi:O-antigen ligase